MREIEDDVVEWEIFLWSGSSCPVCKSNERRVEELYADRKSQVVVVRQRLKVCDQISPQGRKRTSKDDPGRFVVDAAG